MALTEVKIKQAKARDKAYKLFDEKGLFLYITISGAKYWRHKYRFNKKEKGLAYGVYPEVSLKMAREKRDESRRLLSEGVDPGQYRQIQKTQSIEAQTNTFQVVALEWFARAESGWAETTAKK
ncbi:MAG: integrase arm-type DNA-binding domain-containing protein, partial [Pseudomonadales bacterium]|nr:integrase arm-type DNA-binding domain-containing protein [Pseudomonadales bacterium]